MGKNKRRKSRYDLVKTLSPIAFPAEYEELTKSLFKKACQGSRHLWKEITNFEELQNNVELREKFYCSAHEGMMSAQDDIVAIFQSDNKPDFPKELLLRGIADAIAWQFLGNQLAYARRFFKSTTQPDLYNSNLKSVVFAVQELLKDKPSSVSLISDLTSFIQVGDLLIFEPGKGLRIVEVKEGPMNAKIHDFMKFYTESQCDRALQYFANREGEQAVKQLQRMARQADRMLHVSTVISTGKGVDPDSNETIIIPEPFFPIEMWDDRLNGALNKASSQGWAIDVIDNCLFLGVYASDQMRRGGYVVFNAWFDQMGGTPECPRAMLIDSMRQPLALPIFSRNISDDDKFDVLFGRKQVCMGVCIELLLSECVKAGLSVRFATNKERGSLAQTGHQPYKYKGNAIFIGKGSKEIVLMDGIFLRVMFHGQRPISVIKTILEDVEV